MSNNQGKGFQSFDDFYKGLSTANHADFKVGGLKNFVSPAAFDEKRQHLLDLYRDIKVEHSFVDNSGQIFDCVPIDQQPALKKSGKPLATPPKVPGSKSQIVPAAAISPEIGSERIDRYGNRIACPPGTVPIRRITLEEMGRFDSLDHFLRKGPKTPRQIAAKVAPMLAASGIQPQHRYAHAFQQVANVGGHSTLNVWAPPVSDNQVFSLSQHWYVATGTKGLQTAEVGWQVYPEKYGHANPVLFTYWTADGYAATGSYSNDAGHFVQYSTTCPVGLAISDVSVAGGSQAEIELSFLLADGNWWLFVNGTDASHAVGYYPASLFEDGPMATGATEIDFGGETVGAGNYPAMGSGAFSDRGYRQAAYQRNIRYFPAAGGAQDAALERAQDWPAFYTIAMASDTDWGQSFFFGGPGGVEQQGGSEAAPVGWITAAAPADKPRDTGSSRRWSLLTLCFVSAIAGITWWIGFTGAMGNGGLLQGQWLSIEATLLALCIAAGYFRHGRVDGILIDQENRISLSRIQWVTWLVVLFGGFLTESLWNIATGWSVTGTGSFPKMQPELFALLGIVSGSAVVGGIITNNKMNAPNAPVPPAVPVIGKPSNKGLMDLNVDPAEASWADLYLGEEVANRDVIDISRMQKLIVTILLVLTYVRLLWGALGVSPVSGGGVMHFASMPEVGATFVWLLGISHAAYLASKALPKTPPSLPT